MILYKIKLPAKQDAEAFAKFMRDEYFPAVHKGSTRTGKVMSLQLIQGETDTGAATHEFFWMVGFSGLSSGDARVDDGEIQKKFKAFAPKVKRLGAYTEIAAWDEKS